MGERAALVRNANGTTSRRETECKGRMGVLNVKKKKYMSILAANAKSDCVDVRLAELYTMRFKDGYCWGANE